MPVESIDMRAPLPSERRRDPHGMEWFSRQRPRDHPIHKAVITPEINATKIQEGNFDEKLSPRDNTTNQHGLVRYPTSGLLEADS